MLEEFHADNNGAKQLYGWGTLNANIWLPSLSELVGITGAEHGTWGTYLSAMQGMNTSNAHYVDSKGGAQFAYFKQFNASGGGEAIWNACKQEQSWLRSPDLDVATDAWRTTGTKGINAPLATVSHAVHPVVDASSISLASACGESSLTPLHLLSPKRHARLTCSVVNALSTVRTCYHLFVVEGHIGNKLILLQ